MDLPVATISARQGAIFTLPVRGLKVVLREPTGEQDLLLLEAPDDDAAALALAESLARAGDGQPVDWLGLAPSDLDTLVLRVRQMRLGDRVLISPRFHRAHHGVRAAGDRSCNYGAVLPWWDMLFRTADFSREHVRTGDPSGDEALATGTWAQQQVAGLRRFGRTFGRSDVRHGT